MTSSSLTLTDRVPLLCLLPVPDAPVNTRSRPDPSICSVPMPVTTATRLISLLVTASSTPEASIKCPRATPKSSTPSATNGSSPNRPRSFVFTTFVLIILSVLVQYLFVLEQYIIIYSFVLHVYIRLFSVYYIFICSSCNI